MLDDARVHFDIFGVGIAIDCDDVDTARQIAMPLAAYAAPSGDPCAVFHLSRCDTDSPFVAGQLFNSRTLLVAGDNHKLITATLGAPPWQLYVQAYRRTTAYIQGYLFEPLLLMLLKRHGLVHCHAAAVAAPHGTVLIIGDGGAGKSTSTLSLLIAGYRFLADDELFLQVGGQQVYTRAAERVVHCTDETLRLLPGLPDAADLPLVQRGKRKKRRLEIPLPGIASAIDSRTAPPVRLVIFPRVVPEQRTRLEPVGSSDALRRLVLHRPKEHPAVWADAPSLEKQFSTVATLATSAVAYDLVLGADVARVPALIDAVLA